MTAVACDLHHSVVNKEINRQTVKSRKYECRYYSSYRTDTNDQSTFCTLQIMNKTSACNALLEKSTQCNLFKSYFNKLFGF